jgi:prepilin-type processing-associated H-X9-DG protein
MRFPVVVIVVAIALGLCAMACLGFEIPIQLLFLLAFGWLIFLTKTLPQVQWDISAAVWAVLVAGAFSVGLHTFLRWLRASWKNDLDYEPSDRRWRWKWTVALVGIVVLAFVAGISMVGLTHQIAWLATSPEPFVSSLGSNAVHRINSSNNLKQIGIGFATMDRVEGEYPPGVTADDNGHILHGWQTLLLQYMEQTELMERIALDRPWYDPGNRAAISVQVQPYGGMHDQFGDAPNDGLAPSVYAGNSRMLGGLRRYKESDIADGLSRTILAGEITGKLPAWGRPGNWRDPADGLGKNATTFGSPWKQGVNFLFCDGSVQNVAYPIDSQVLRALATPAGGDAADLLEHP